MCICTTSIFQNHFSTSLFFPLLPNLWTPFCSTLHCVTSIMLIFFFFKSSFLSLLYTWTRPLPFLMLVPWKEWTHWMVIHSSLSGASPNCGSPVLLLFLLFSFFFFFSDTIFFQLGTRVSVWQVCHRGPSKFICLSVITISHCHNTKLLTIDRECLFNHGDSSHLSPSV